MCSLSSSATYIRREVYFSIFLLHHPRTSLLTVLQVAIIFQPVHDTIDQYLTEWSSFPTNTTKQKVPPKAQDGKNVCTYFDRIRLSMQSYTVPLSRRETTGSDTSMTIVTYLGSLLLPDFSSSMIGLRKVFSCLTSTF